jgi:ribonuclease E
VNVVLIPNIHMETPHYTITRLRHDELNLSGAAEPSYKMAVMPEAEAIYQTAGSRSGAPGRRGQVDCPAKKNPPKRQPLRSRLLPGHKVVSAASVNLASAIADEVKVAASATAKSGVPHAVNHARPIARKAARRAQRSLPNPSASRDLPSHGRRLKPRHRELQRLRQQPSKQAARSSANRAAAAVVVVAAAKIASNQRL